ncbi:MAG: metal ABC transporter ATP-binding protein [Candidatus Electryonea clarkiae]|nr:metal ABC transporter ATP-binding protein [Candidatus Electryonea clarkiae]MDP8289011.1 metal ABC transporter ATP-binding protein [Candidatus Electryonea clarkiae]
MKVSVEIENLWVRSNDNVILENISCCFEAGKLNAVIGPNGAGKTTLIQTILGFTSYEGKIKFIGTEKPRISFVPQNPDIDQNTPVTVEDYLAAGLMQKPVWLNKSSKISNNIDAVLKDVGVEGRLHRRLGDLSGGEMQRVLLAQALLRKPDLLLLDEPQTSVDIAGAQLFCGLIEEVHQLRQLTTLFVSHDIGAVIDHANRVIGLNKKILFTGKCPDVLDDKNLTKLFGPHAPSLRYSTQGEHDHSHHHHQGDVI